MFMALQASLIDNILSHIGDGSLTPVSGTVVHTVQKCFVDLNLQLNENVNSYLQTNRVSFSTNQYNSSEGQVSQLKVLLNFPSNLGVEEVDLYYLGSSSTAATISGDIMFTQQLTQPIRLSWSAGEQQKLIYFTGVTDYFRENTEEFFFKLDHFLNCQPGTFVNAKLSLLNVDNFPDVFIQSTNGSYYPDSTGGYKLKFGLNEGDTKNIVVSLSFPSVQGGEEVDVVFTNQTASSNDYTINIPQPIRLSWAVGEQTKIISIKGNIDADASDLNLETLLVELKNPLYTNISATPTTLPNTGFVKFPSASIEIVNVPPIYEYVRVYLGPFYAQAGGKNILSKYTNSLKNFTSYSNGYSKSKNSSFILYSQNAPNTYIPAGSSDVLNSFNKSRLKIVIKNSGNLPALINGTNVSVGNSIVVDNLIDNFYIDLPANMNLVSNNIGQGIVQGAQYTFTYVMSYNGNPGYSDGDFVLRNLNNTASPSGTFNLNPVFFSTSDQNLFTNPSKTYYITTRLKNVTTGRSLSNSCPINSFNVLKVEDVRLRGLFFIEKSTSSLFGSLETRYLGVEFIQNGIINYTCAYPLQQAIPFQVI